MPQDTNYAHLLRPVGQMLEALGVESFVVSVEGDDFVVKGRKRQDRRPATQEKSLRVMWQMLSRTQAQSQTNPTPSSGVLELRYTPDEIAKMDDEGKAKRAGSGGTPEAHALSQILRSVGAFVDQKVGRLIAIKKEDHNITIEYESALKRKITEEFTVSSLYDYWVRMYLRRKERPQVKG